MGNNGDLKKEETQEQKPIQLIITAMPNGKVNLTGPINNRLLCYGLLRMAEEILYDFSRAQKVDLIKPTSDNVIDLIRRQ